MVNNTINVEILDHVLAFLNGLESLSSSKLIWKTITLPDLWKYMVSVLVLQILRGKIYGDSEFIFLGILTLNS